MKITLTLLTLVTSFTFTHAQDAYSDASYCEPGVSYAAPVVYQAPVIYQAPVTYYAPVYYLASAATTAIYTSSPGNCSGGSTVIHITSGRGVYTTSSCDYNGSSVIYIGSRYAWPGSARLRQR